MDTKIIKLHKQGLSNREIGRIMSLHHKTIAKYLNKYKLVSTGYKNDFTLGDDQLKYKCTKCNKNLNRNMFTTGRSGKKNSYRFFYCKDCRRKQTYLNLNNNINSFLFCRFTSIKNRANKVNIEFNLDKDYFVDLYNKQGGKCFYTGITLVTKVGEGKNPNSLSVDRLDFKKGYIKGNIVFCSNRINTIKSDMTLEELKNYIPKWYKKIINYGKF